MVKSEKFGHFHLIYHFTIPLMHVSTSISDDMKKLFTKKKDILNFAFPKSVIYLSTNVNRNLMCF